LKPFYILLKDLEGKSDDGMFPYTIAQFIVLILVGNHGYAWQVIPSYDLMQAYIDECLVASTAYDYRTFQDVDEIRAASPPPLTLIKTNILNAQAKLKKYRDLLISPVYLVAMVLVP
jgi:hypothetical protein